jgi:hypothetical protein
MPFLPLAGSVTAKTMARSAVLPEVMNCLVPLRTQWLPSRLARVLSEEASEPACGSVRQKQPSSSPWASGRRNYSFCSCVPNFSSGMQTTELCTLMMVEVEASPAAISSTASA